MKLAVVPPTAWHKEAEVLDLCRDEESAEADAQLDGISSSGCVEEFCYQDKGLGWRLSSFVLFSVLTMPRSLSHCRGVERSKEYLSRRNIFSVHRKTIEIYFPGALAALKCIWQRRIKRVLQLRNRNSARVNPGSSTASILRKHILLMARSYRFFLKPPRTPTLTADFSGLVMMASSDFLRYRVAHLRGPL